MELMGCHGPGYCLNSFPRGVELFLRRLSHPAMVSLSFPFSIFSFPTSASTRCRKASILYSLTFGSHDGRLSDVVDLLSAESSHLLCSVNFEWNVAHMASCEACEGPPLKMYDAECQQRIERNKEAFHRLGLGELITRFCVCPNWPPACIPRRGYPDEQDAHMVRKL